MKNYPKIECPFVRQPSAGRYLVTPIINPGYEWVFKEPDVLAVDKLDGTNVGIRIEKGKISRIFNRETEKFIWNIHQTRWEGACMEGLAKAIQRGWLKRLEDGDYYGELIGELFNGNPHSYPGHIFVPFDYLKKSCFWKSWSANKYPKTFESISAWFENGLPSLFNQRLRLPVIDSEGIVFYRSNGERAKIRRDMFDWYNGLNHKE